MCGIAAVVSRDATALAAVDAMNATLVHRGPDDCGSIVLRDEGVALAMRRLSIIDLAGGHQPMWDEEERHGVVFNGEIYNFDELRQELTAAGHRFSTHHSDTEVLVHGFDEWGTGLFERLNGMFAFALWDRERRRLIVARDRVGEKPLYVARLPDGFAVASELKAILRCPGVEREVDPVALEQYLAFDYALAPRTMLRNVEKLPAGHYAEISESAYEPRPYWRPAFRPRSMTEAEAIARLDECLSESVRMRMVADVPVGLFLSGGLDSTTVGYYMRRHAEDVRSFAIGFEERAFDESAYADLAAKSLGTKHHLEVFSQRRILDLVPRIADILDEPMGDPSIFPTHLLSLFTRQHVKVALGGDGSDELLMGYKAYQPLKVAWQLDVLPTPVRRTLARVARNLPTYVGSTGLRGVIFARRLDQTPPQRLLSHLGANKGSGRWLLSPAMRSELPQDPFAEPERQLLQGLNGVRAPEQTIASYLRGYLQDDILVKVDRASMAASLEVRAPFLDPDLIDLTLQMPAALKLRRQTRKYVLRQLMRGRIPDAIIDRPKLGFGVPISPWLRDSLRPLLQDVLSTERIRRGGIFDPKAVDLLVRRHLSGERDHGNQLWLLLQFELWKQRWLDTPAP